MTSTTGFEGWLIYCPFTKKFLADDEHSWTPDDGQAAVITDYKLAKDIGFREAPTHCTFMLVASPGIISRDAPKDEDLAPVAEASDEDRFEAHADAMTDLEQDDH